MYTATIIRHDATIFYIHAKVMRGNFDHSVIPITAVNIESIAQQQEMFVLG